MLQQVMSQIAAVKKDMIILEKSEFSTLLAESEVGAFPFAGKFRCVGALCCFCGEPLFLVFVFFPFISQKLKLQLFQLSVQLAVGSFYFTPNEICCVLCFVLSFHPGKTFCVEQWFVYRLFV